MYRIEIYIGSRDKRGEQRDKHSMNTYKKMIQNLYGYIEQGYRRGMGRL